MTTIDNRLIELDLDPVNPVRISASQESSISGSGLANYPKSYFVTPTSAPTVADGLIVVGGAVVDSTNVDVPSGVVRAFDARTGELRWVWTWEM